MYCSFTNFSSAIIFNSIFSLQLVQFLLHPFLFKFKFTFVLLRYTFRWWHYSATFICVCLRECPSTRHILSMLKYASLHETLLGAWTVKKNAVPSGQAHICDYKAMCKITAEQHKSIFVMSKKSSHFQNKSIPINNIQLLSRNNIDYEL